MYGRAPRRLVPPTWTATNPRSSSSCERGRGLRAPPALHFGAGPSSAKAEAQERTAPPQYALEAVGNPPGASRAGEHGGPRRHHSMERTHLAMERTRLAEERTRLAERCSGSPPHAASRAAAGDGTRRGAGQRHRRFESTLRFFDYALPDDETRNIGSSRRALAPFRRAQFVSRANPTFFACGPTRRSTATRMRSLCISDPHVRTLKRAASGNPDECRATFAAKLRSVLLSAAGTPLAP